MLFLRIKQAEAALADGRLDEAFEIAKAADLRKQRSGQDLVGHLARALLDRGREHLDADRPIPAAHDCEKAEQLGRAIAGKDVVLRVAGGCRQGFEHGP